MLQRIGFYIEVTFLTDFSGQESYELIWWEEKEEYYSLYLHFCFVSVFYFSGKKDVIIWKITRYGPEILWNGMTEQPRNMEIYNW